MNFCEKMVVLLKPNAVQNCSEHANQGTIWAALNFQRELANSVWNRLYSL